MEHESVYTGIDVSRAQLDVAVHPADDRWELSNDQAGIEELVSRLKTLGPTLVLLGATGGYELPLVAALAANEVPIAVVSSRQVREFAGAAGILAKTDTLDAAVLARFAEVVQPPVRPMKEAETQNLKALVARRHQVAGMLVAEKNRLCANSMKPYVQGSSSTSNGLRRNSLAWKGIWRRPSGGVPLWRENDDLLRRRIRRGPQLSFSLLAHLPGLGTLDRRKIAALAGVALFNRDRGMFRGQRTTSLSTQSRLSAGMSESDILVL